MKRAIFLVLMLGLLGGVLWFWYHLPVAEIRALNLVPKDAVFLIECKQPIQSWKDLQRNSIWKHLLTHPYYQEINQNIQALDSLIQQKAELSAWIGNRPVWISVHLIRPNDYDFLYIIDLKKEAKINFLAQSLQVFANHLGHQLTTRTYQNQEIYELQNKQTKDILSFAFLSNHVIISYQGRLIEKSIDELQKPYLGNDPTFHQLKKLSGNEAITIYIQHRLLPAFARVYMSEDEPIVQELARSIQYSGLDFSVEEQSISLQGYSILNDSIQDSYLQAMLSVQPGNAKIWKIAPKQTAIFSSIGIDDYLKFHEQLENELRKKSETWEDYQKNVKRIEKLLKINIKKDFLSWIGNEIALLIVNADSTNPKPEPVVIIHANDVATARNGLKHITTQIKKRTPVKFKVLEYREHEISYLEIKGFFRLFLGKLFAKMEKPYFVLHDDYVIFSNSIETLKFMIDQIIEKNTLEQENNAQTLFSSFPANHNFLSVVRMEQLYPMLPVYLSASTVAKIQQNESYVRSFREIGFVVESKETHFYTKWKINHSVVSPQVTP
ncbi:MAG: DUF3352 domain-containing protein [Bacteroidia bacterium]|nr:DUF3352 domain-containing protein [Bacteroidia bacterium]